MSRFLLPAAALLTLALAACTPKTDEQEQAVALSEERAQEAAQPAPAPPVTAATCDDSQAQWAIGKKPTEADIEQARKDSGAETVRALKPGQAVTMEFNASRLNLDLDDTGVVTAIRCG
jgi:hypothetical protein